MDDKKSVADCPAVIVFGFAVRTTVGVDDAVCAKTLLDNVRTENIRNESAKNFIFIFFNIFNL